MLVLRRILAFFLLVFFTPLFIISLSISQVSSVIQNPHTLTQFIEKTYFVGKYKQENYDYKNELSSKSKPFFYL